MPSTTISMACRRFLPSSLPTSRWCGSRPVTTICIQGRCINQPHIGIVAAWSSEASTELRTAAHRLRVCVVGAGPAGFYATKYLLKEEAELRRGIEIDILDRLPTPFGLVRYGVAPDHPEVKAVQADFEQVASDPRVHFFGNVSLGRDVSAAHLSDLYDVVLLTYGAAGDRELTVPGAHLRGVFAARTFVSWYNGHPDFAHMTEDFRAALASSDTVAVIGVGNVALDCARILAKGSHALEATDICDHTLKVLSSVGSSLRRVVVLGRRGHVQASFTIKELRELTKLDDVRCLVRKNELEMGRTPASLDEVKAKRPKNRVDALLTKMAEESEGAVKNEKAVELRFLVGLSEILPNDADPTRLGAIRIERNILEVDNTTGSQHAVGSGDKDEVMKCGMVLGSIGYRCLSVEGVPYDERNSTIMNDGGRVPGISGMYCSGWARRGPTGIIGSNITDARSVASAIVEDIRAGNLDLSRNTEGRKGLKRLLSRGPSEPRDSEGVQIVDWDGYREIDRDEVTRGKLKGKPREKIVDVAKMLKVANSGASS